MPQRTPESLINAGRVVPRARWSMPLHVHETHDELVLVVAGELHTHLGGRVLVGTPGSVLHYPSGVAHAEQAVGSMPLETLFLAFRAPRGLKLAPVSRDRSGHVLHALRWLLELSASRRQQERSIAENILAAVLHELAAEAEPRGSEMIRRVQRYIEYHLADRITLDDLADEAGMSKFHFARTFTRATGRTPMSYVRHVRIEAARRLLSTSALPLRALAPLVGLGDQTQLARTFRRLTGQTPAAYRRNS